MSKNCVILLDGHNDFAEGESEICEFNKKYYFVGKDDVALK
ncbi:hypothetical protein [Metabacillus sp. B2-18]|nr:hypothetical protein [Metabacillus sp. B2-18]